MTDEYARRFIGTGIGGKMDRGRAGTSDAYCFPAVPSMPREAVVLGAPQERLRLRVQ